MPEAIVARGVRVHNLKAIDVSIPAGRLVVVTGVSGSGKSSLAFDTLYAEGQRRYVESLSAYARQFLERMEKPDVDSIEGICPSIALRQRAPSRSPRSTVATATEIHDHLRLLYARVGRTMCGDCGVEARTDSADAAAERLIGQAGGEPVLVGFPLQPNGLPLGELLERLRRKGFHRILAGGAAVPLDALDSSAGVPAEAAVVVDRLRPRPEDRSRLADSLETAFSEGGGEAVAQIPGGLLLRFSQRFACPRCGRACERPQPRLFSFNSPYGACPACHGFGNRIELDVALVVPDPKRTLAQGAVEPWRKPRARGFLAELRRAARRHGIPMDVPWSELSEDHRRLVLEGDEEFAGVAGFFRWLEARKYRVQVRALLTRYRGYHVCAACNGSRLRPEALRVQVGGRGIHELCELSVDDARAFLGSLALAGEERAVAERIVRELQRRLGFLSDVGLGYLTLGRAFGTLSGGEAQRIGLAAALGTGMVGALYVLDEPSVGLHPRDTDRLLASLRALTALGNTVVVVEHDSRIIAAADHIVDLGPGAGELGGRIVFEGSYRELLEDGRGLTSKFLRRELQRRAARPRRKPSSLALVIRGARARNLKEIDVRLPLGALTCVTGVSGSGKSTLVHDVLVASLLRRKGRAAPEGCRTLEGADYVEEVVLVDQAPIGRTPRSNPVTYLKAFDEIRELFAATPAARARGLLASHFSFNVAGGRCEACDGDGRVKLEMQFLADAYLVCDACGGRRYRPEVLEVEYRGRRIDQVLEMTAHEAAHFFASRPRLVRRLRLFEQIGLGYLRLGQPASSLSGGEAQRLKLAAHLSHRAGQRVLYVLDEPTTGLHLADVHELLGCLERLLERGASVVVIEHNMEFVRHADWVVDLGPEGGAAGGQLVFQGPPDALALQGGGFTSLYLREALDPAGHDQRYDRP
jgi:excinuclease ABC subunit A